MPEERYRVVLETCPSCAKMTHVGPETGGQGRSLGVDPVVQAEAACDHEAVDLTRDARLSHAIPPATRRRVLHRDRYRCAVPGCASHVWCDVHHLVPRAAGGRHTLENLITICTVHHRMVHDGTMALERGGDGRVVSVRQTERTAPHPALAWLVDGPQETTVLARAAWLHDGPSSRDALRAAERRGQVVRTPRGEWVLTAQLDDGGLASSP